MRSTVIAALVLSALGLGFCAAGLRAFENPLTSEDIRNAYFLATGDAAKRDAFLADYTQHFATPRQGPQIASIELTTPWANAVRQMAHAPNDREPDVQERYQGKFGDIRIQAVAYFTPAWPRADVTADQRNSFWNDFQIQLWQDGAEISSRAIRAWPIYNERAMTGYIGATVETDYDARSVRSEPVTVIVNGPANARVKTEFDLARLR